MQTFKVKHCQKLNHQFRNRKCYNRLDSQKTNKQLLINENENIKKELSIQFVILMS